MCGIVGIVNLKEPQFVPEDLLRQMLAAIRHRGPDEFGIYRDEWASLGNARLSIVDLGGGQQPIGNEDGSLWIVFNGEIFNYLELRPILEAEGHRFRTDCDTEVILHLYEKYGPSCLNYLNGQFAIAIWDNWNRSLFLARDRLGICPLFYSTANGQLVFGSEIKTLLIHPQIQAEIDPDSLAQIFTFWSVLVPRSIFKKIYNLPPAHYLLIQGGQLQVHPYWEPDFTIPATPERTTEEYLEEFECLLIDATLLRLRADVPVGAYLSGGLDSSTTTAIIRQYTSNSLDTFSIAFSDPTFDESQFQQYMAAFLGTEHQVIDCTQADIGQAFPQMLWHTEMPTLRTAPAPMFLLSRLVRDHNLKVVITGEGADEFLGGYDIFKEMAIRRFWAKQPHSTRRPQLLKRLYPEIARLSHSSEAFLTAFFKQDLTDIDSPIYSHLIRWSNTAKLHRFLRQRPGESIRQWAEDLVPLPARFRQWSPLGQAQYLEIVTFLSPYLLCSQGDRVAMAHSVEGRFPFLDYRLVEFANRLPPQLKLRGLKEKWLLRQLASKRLPPEIWQRRKRPYRAPIHRSFFGPDAPTYVNELLSPPALEESGLFNPLAVSQLVNKAQKAQQLSEVEDMAIAGLISTQLIYQQFIKAFPSQFPTLGAKDRVKVVNRGT
ncbi:asparagine synthase (glutamine-hydrolyzing) [Trichothermofontia sichuanensis B231]|uniref:asparagine synthase (glutamine-hydrolyzing) n=1 Tax=Trichothermofontia sichuanensis TaxID=3045816 RepID=UPI002247A16E|nr:asparagine synthase (glutamine-hydrolyzing) [Trichothermofontia sichuanensis]UZQ54773.1 asparagine synthase (glutamine-hydrolyzing) [Trichothermofontia sichuanensis B231]